MKSSLRDEKEYELKIQEAKKILDDAIFEAMKISQDLENPNQERFRTLDGYDPSENECKHTISTLERLERSNREILLSQDIEVENVSAHIRDMQESSRNWKTLTQPLYRDINELQGRLLEMKRIRTSHLSEIKMYDDLIENVKKSIEDQQSDILLREELANMKRATSEEPKEPIPKETKRNSPVGVEAKRPTAYFPDDDEETIRVPKPVRRKVANINFKAVTDIHFGIDSDNFFLCQYGMAPFHPTSQGRAMRHIRKPKKTVLL